jgi:hypothetical protein
MGCPSFRMSGHCYGFGQFRGATLRPEFGSRRISDPATLYLLRTLSPVTGCARLSVGYMHPNCGYATCSPCGGVWRKNVLECSSDFRRRLSHLVGFKLTACSPSFLAIFSQSWHGNIPGNHNGLGPFWDHRRFGAGPGSSFMLRFD